MSRTRIYWLHALSPTHAGIGRGVGYIDLPIDREGVTNWPIIRSSAFKGVWRDWAEQREPKDITERAFGRADKGGETANSGSLIPTDARLVCLPARSFRGTFAWTTSPLCLRMLRRTLELAGTPNLPDAPGELGETEAHHAKETLLTQNKSIYLEDLDFEAVNCPIANQWAEAIAGWVFPEDEAWRDVFKKRFVVLPDDAFNFLCETGTEVHARVKIHDDTKTVVDGALWSEESLPAETILAGFVQCDRVFGGNGEEIKTNGLLDRFTGEPLDLQIGGKATVGRGRVRCVFTKTSGVEQ